MLSILKQCTIASALVVFFGLATLDSFAGQSREGGRQSREGGKSGEGEKSIESAVSVFGRPLTLAQFSLQAQTGEPFSKADMKGHWSLMFIGFTSCPDICPTTLAQLQLLHSELAAKLPPLELPTIHFVAVDPERDRPVLTDYLNHFNASIIGLTGQASDLEALVKSIGGYYRLDQNPDDQGNYDVVHSASIAVINPKAEMIGRFTHPFDVKSVARDLGQLIKFGHLKQESK